MTGPIGELDGHAGEDVLYHLKWIILKQDRVSKLCGPESPTYVYF